MDIAKTAIGFGSTYDINRANGNLGKPKWTEARKLAESLNGTNLPQSGISAPQSIKMSVPKEKDAEIEAKLKEWDIVWSKKHNEHGIPSVEALRAFFKEVYNKKMFVNRRASY
jgi:hypothetical protein